MYVPTIELTLRQISAKERQSHAPSFPIDHLADSVIELEIPAFRRRPLLFATNHKFDIAPGVAAHTAKAFHSKRGERWRQ